MASAMEALREQRREMRRKYFRSLKKGDMVVCGGAPGPVTMKTSQGMLTMTPPESEQERQAREKREFVNRYCRYD